ncbi:unnamed protein product [Gongylonema pulchrum]|uniref:Transcriptional regulator n=1 Tax=Gongylonema pulchrum TaxID=637853 RepID=A0A183F1H9_9BILA|nr:unnamed protein product [Gongylonema pulchrum]
MCKTFRSFRIRYALTIGKQHSHREVAIAENKSACIYHV